jgi:hypothetical protein
VPTSKTRCVLLAVAAFVLIVTVALVLWFIDLKKTASVDILVAPTAATVKVGYKNYRNGSHRLEPGEYNVSISMDGFKTHTQKLSVKDKDKLELYVALERTDGGLDWYADRPEEDAVYTAIADKNYEKQANIFAEKYPIVKVLPIRFANYVNNYSEYIEYRIDYELSDSGDKLVLVITDVTGGNRERALQKIRDKGFNPDDYEVEYRQQS